MNKIRSLFLVFSFLTTILGTGQLNAQELYLIFLNSNPNKLQLPKCDVDALQAGHIDNIDRLYDEGKLLMAGPFDGGGGIFILKTNSREEANELLKTDPAIAADRFIVENLPLGIQKGFICEQTEPYEMIQYNFIEYHPADNNEIAIPFLDQKDHANKEIVSFSAAISYENDRIGFIAILPYEEDAKSYAEQSPLVVKGTHTFTVKTFWTTDQTFCTDENKKIN